MHAEPLDYASAQLDKPRWGPVLIRPARHTHLVILLSAATALWLSLRHEPWRHVAIPIAPDVQRILFTPSGKLLAVGHFTAHVIDPSTGRILHRIGEDPGDMGTFPPGIVATRGGREIVKFFYDHVALYDTDTGATLGTFDRPLVGTDVLEPCFATLPDTRAILLKAKAEYPSADQPDLGVTLPVGLHSWDLDAARPARTSPLPTHRFVGGADVECSNDGRVAAVIMRYTDALKPPNPPVALVEVASGRQVPLDPPPPPGFAFNAFSGDSRWMFLDDPSRRMNWVYSASTGKRLPVLPPRPTRSYLTPVEPSPDARFAATETHSPGFSDPVLHLYDLNNPATPVADRAIPGSNLLRPRFSPDGTRIFARAGGVGHFALYDVPHLHTVARLPGPTGLYEATFSPDGRSLVAPGTDGQLHLYQKVGLECRESALGVLGMPHAWLLILLLTLTAVSLRSDARRRAPEPPTRTLAVISTLLLIAALPRTIQVLLSACLREPLLTPAPILLLCAIGLATGSRFWRLASIVALGATAAVEFQCAAGVQLAGLAMTTTLPILDRTLDIPNRLLVPALVAAGIAALAALTRIPRHP